MIKSHMGTTVALALLILLASVTPGLAADMGVSVRAGTQGAGAEFGIGFTKWFTLRGGVYRLTFSESFEEAGIDYDAGVKLGGTGVLADFFPSQGSFRVTAGLFSNNNEIDLKAIPTMDQEIGGTSYTPMEIGTLSGDVTFDDTAPYFGIGWGNIARGKRVGFMFDAGILKQGSGEVSLTTNGTLQSDPFLFDLAAEAMELEDDISDFDIWPVISFGLSIRF